jgi:Derlin-2/3|tara:strand:+ start:659 stop:892 length:234 start_codon:yes stop_codon:yes gene_type:complete
MSLFGLFPFTAPYLPWVMLAFSMLMGNSPTIDLIGMAVGHMYFFAEFVYPKLAEIRGWRIRRLMDPPLILKWICGEV